MGEIATLASAGGGGLLVLVIIYLLAGGRADRQQYEDHIDRAEDRAVRAEARVATVNEQLDAERKRRREAEDQAADLRRKQGSGP